MTHAASPSSLRDLVQAGVLDAELGGLLKALVEAGMPVVVAGTTGSGREAVASSVTASRTRDVPEVVELASTDGPETRMAARGFVGAAAEGLPVAATIEAGDLEGVFARLEAPPIGLTRDELSHIGVVLVLGDGQTPAGAPTRIVAAHWVRPLARDGHGHLQRLGPAVLATWDPREGAWEHFAWGVLPELALRLGRPAGDLEREAAAGAARLAAPDA